MLFSALTTVITAAQGLIQPSDVGLAISYALQISVYLNLLVRFMADTEMQMNAVERVMFYTSLATEPSEGKYCGATPLSQSSLKQQCRPFFQNVGTTFYGVLGIRALFTASFHRPVGQNSCYLEC